MKRTVNIFFACNDTYVPYLDVALISLIEHASECNDYQITILKTDISEANQEKIKAHQTENVKIRFYDVQKLLEPIKETLPDMFHYTLAAYYRLFIETAFPEYDKAVYLDSDFVLLSDVAELYDLDIGDNLVAAAHEQNTERDARFTNYVQDVLGIPPHTYFNSGVLVMNLKEFRKFQVQKRFLTLLTTYNFDCLAPDQEYLNVICKDRVYNLPIRWNKHSFPEPPDGELKLCHYALANKPWHYEDTINGEYFWEYAQKSVFYPTLLETLKNYSEQDKRKDYQAYLGLLEGIENMKRSERTFKKLWFENPNREEIWKNL